MVNSLMPLIITIFYFDMRAEVTDYTREMS